MHAICPSLLIRCGLVILLPIKRSHLFTESFKLLTVEGESNETQTMGQQG